MTEYIIDKQFTIDLEKLLKEYYDAGNKYPNWGLIHNKLRYPYKDYLHTNNNKVEIMLSLCNKYNLYVVIEAINNGINIGLFSIPNSERLCLTQGGSDGRDVNRVEIGKYLHICKFNNAFLMTNYYADDLNITNDHILEYQ